MTVSSSTRRAGPFNGNGVTTAFPFTFKVFSTEDVAVYLADPNGDQTRLSSNYTVTLNGDQDASPGGTVTYPTSGSPLAEGYSLVMVGALDYNQGTDLTNVGRYLPNVVENALDKVTILAQQLLEQRNRAIQMPVTYAGSGELPSASPAGKYVGFDVDGNPALLDGSGAASDAQQVSFTQAGADIQARSVRAKLRETFSVTDIEGVDPTGATDSTAGLAIAFARGGDIHVPAGDYLIAGTGADSGGVEVTLTASTRILCEEGARFFTDSLDNDFFRFVMPTGGIGLPADGIDFEWRGGLGDQRDQKNSTVVPFMTEYPVSDPGASATCDFLSVRGEYAVGATPHHGINRAVVIGLTTIAGDHWQTAGGDSGVYLSGARIMEAHYCRHVGARDLGQYFSADDAGVLACSVVAQGNRFEHCFGGVNAKRSCVGVDFIANHFENCVRALGIDHLAGNGTKRAYIAGNTGIGCGILARLQYVFGGSIEGNHFSDSGALLADGVTAESSAGMEGFSLMGCAELYVAGNTAIGVKAAPYAAYPTSGRFMYTPTYDPGTGAVSSTYITFARNLANGYRTSGVDSGDRNSFIENLCLNAVSPYITASGTNVCEVRVDSNNVRIFNNPVQFVDGSAAAPSIARRGATNVGIFFATNKLGLSAGGERVAVNTSGVGFNGAVPVARPVYAAPTGTATRSTFDTATVTLPLLAERVKALIDDLRTYGLAG